MKHRSNHRPPKGSPAPDRSGFTLSRQRFQIFFLVVDWNDQADSLILFPRFLSSGFFSLRGRFSAEKSAQSSALFQQPVFSHEPAVRSPSASVAELLQKSLHFRFAAFVVFSDTGSSALRSSSSLHRFPTYPVLFHGYTDTADTPYPTCLRRIFSVRLCQDAVGPLVIEIKRDGTI